MTPSAVSSLSNSGAAPEVTGWLLSEAQAALNAHGYTVRLVETGPPPRQAPQNKPQRTGKLKTRRVPVFGEWRVLRCRELNTAEATVELLAARELLGEERIEAPDDGTIPTDEFKT